MKGTLLALLIIAAVLVATVESGRRKFGKSKLGKGRLCLKGCLNCSNETACVKCKKRFNLNQETKRCEKKGVISTCPPKTKKCVACSDDGTCTRCQRGFALLVSTKRRRGPCIPCKKVARKASKFRGADKSQCKTRKVKKGGKRKTNKKDRKEGKRKSRPTSSPSVQP